MGTCHNGPEPPSAEAGGGSRTGPIGYRVPVIRRTQPRGSDLVRVSFSLPLAETPENVSVVGDFNDWDPAAHPLRKRSNGTRSVSIDLPKGETFAFKYLAGDGQWLVEPDAEAAPAVKRRSAFAKARARQAA